MRTYLLSITAALTLFTITPSAFSKDDHIGPGVVKVKSSHDDHRYHDRFEGLYDLYESERCGALRPVCTHKEELERISAGLNRDSPTGSHS